MSLYGTPWTHDDIDVIGTSLAGIRTCLTLPEFQCAFDVGQGLPFALAAKHYFITHGHMDHASGIPYLISLKNLNKHAAPIFYLPEYLIEPLSQIMSAWEQVEGFKYNYQFVSVNNTSRIEISRSLCVRPFQTVHRIPSLGYTIFRSHKSLAPALHGHSREEILRRKSLGEKIEEIREEPIFTFTGDTQIEFIKSAPWILHSKILAVECTYYDEQRTVAQARQWGHIHLDEIIQQLPNLKCEKILLIHRSLRYSLARAQELLLSKCSDPRVEIFADSDGAQRVHKS